MRIVLGFLSGVVGMLAGWFGLAFLVIALAGPDRDGGVAMGAFFNIGPLGALIGFGVGVWLFVKFGLVAQGAAFATTPFSEPASALSPAVTVAPAPARISRPFAVVVLAIVGGLAWWAWYELKSTDAGSIAGQLDISNPAMTAGKTDRDQRGHRGGVDICAVSVRHMLLGITAMTP
jgi:hypothetical protein